jgi:hypothetical protein
MRIAVDSPQQCGFPLGVTVGAMPDAL